MPISSSSQQTPSCDLGGARMGAGSVKAARMWNWEMAISFKNKSVFSLGASQGPLVFPVTRQSACRSSSDSFHPRFNWAKLHYVCKFPSANQCGLDITVCADWGLQAPGHILPTEGEREGREGGREGQPRPGCYIPELGRKESNWSRTRVQASRAPAVGQPTWT